MESSEQLKSDVESILGKYGVVDEQLTCELALYVAKTVRTEFAEFKGTVFQESKTA